MPRTIRTEDGVILTEGDRAFDYYGMAWGTIGAIDADLWFMFTHDDGSRSLLNGARIATYDPRDRNPSWPVA